MIRSYTTAIVYFKEIATNTIEVGFEKPAGFTFMPGQYISIVLPELGEAPYHEFSLSSSPNVPVLTVTFRVSDSSFKQTLLNKKVGETITIEGPFGNFYPVPDASEVIFIAGGIGVTPFHSIALSQPGYDINLLTYNTDAQSSPYRNELSALKHISVTEHLDVISPTHFSALTHATAVFIAGPNGFVQAARQAVVAAGISEQHIRTEEFTGYAS